MKHFCLILLLITSYLTIGQNYDFNDIINATPSMREQMLASSNAEINANGTNYSVNTAQNQGVFERYYLDQDNDGFGNANSAYYYFYRAYPNVLEGNGFTQTITESGETFYKFIQEFNGSHYARIDNQFPVFDCNDFLAGDMDVVQTYYLDIDGDSLGGAIALVQLQGSCTQNFTQLLSFSIVTNNQDCYDNSVLVTTNPINWYPDEDSDGFGDVNASPTNSCIPPSIFHVGNANDCNDQDGEITTAVMWYPDNDLDGFVDFQNGTTSCVRPGPNYYREGVQDVCPNDYGENIDGCPGYQVDPTLSKNFVYQRSFNEKVKKDDNLYQGTESSIDQIVHLNSLGQQEQSTTILSNHGFKNLTQHIIYDGQNRIDKNIIATPTNVSNGRYLDDLLLISQSFHGSDNPYSENVFNEYDGSLSKQASAGEAWHLENGHVFRQEATAYNSGDAVKNYKVVYQNGNLMSPQIVDDGTFESGQLFKKISKDQNWDPETPLSKDHTVEEYYDSKNRLILKRQFSGSEIIETYYLYDYMGNMIFTFSPELSKLNRIPTSQELDDLAFQYRYDGKTRLVQKKVPGKAWEVIIYDALDRIVLTQNGTQRESHVWSFTKYDFKGREVYSGLWDDSNNRRSRKQLQDLFDIPDNVNGTYEVRTINEQGSEIYIHDMAPDYEVFYSNKLFPNQNLKILSVNYYDEYGTVANNNDITFQLNQIHTPSGPIPNESYDLSFSLQTFNLPILSHVKVLEERAVNSNAIYYDDRSRPIYIMKFNGLLELFQENYFKLAFDGRVLEQKTNHKNITVKDYFEFDALHRSTKHSQKVDDNSEKIISSVTYNDLGQIKDKSLANNSESLKYAYNIHGWLKYINNPDNLGDHLFAYKLNYETTEGAGETEKMYNGNISQSIWKTGTIDPSGNLNEKKSYYYSYDGIDRLTKGIMKSGTALNTDFGYDTSLIEYDLNGNIERLMRSDANATIDDLYYSYDGNQLQAVEDDSGNTEGFKNGNANSNDFDYDGDGNLKFDKNKGINSIAYNHLHLPTIVTTGQGTINYTYDANGKKLAAVFNPTSGNSSNKFYAGRFIYKNSEIDKILNEEGYVLFDEGNQRQIIGLKDHLGNTRVTYESKDPYSFKDRFEEGGLDDWHESHTNGNVTIINDGQRVKATIKDKYYSIQKLVSIDSDKDVHISFDYEKVDIEHVVFTIMERINGVWEPWQDRDYVFNLEDGNYDLIFDNLTGDYLKITFEKVNTIDDGIPTSFYIDNFSLYQDADAFITQENNYYAFGMQHKGYNNLVSGNINPYGFGGKEMNDELGLEWYDFHARNYDAAIGRWMNIDPLADLMATQGPYNYAFNNPIRLIDPDGRMPYDSQDYDYMEDRMEDTRTEEVTERVDIPAIVFEYSPDPSKDFLEELFFEGLEQGDDPCRYCIRVSSFDKDDTVQYQRLENIKTNNYVGTWNIEPGSKEASAALKALIMRKLIGKVKTPLGKDLAAIVAALASGSYDIRSRVVNASVANVHNAYGDVYFDFSSMSYIFNQTGQSGTYQVMLQNANTTSEMAIFDNATGEMVLEISNPILDNSSSFVIRNAGSVDDFD